MCKFLLPICLAFAAVLPARADEAAPSVPVALDGNTAVVGTERIRLANSVAPEMIEPHCMPELRAGLKARNRLAELLRSGPVLIKRSGADRFGRTLARLTVGGRDVGALLIQEGLALPWQEGAASREAQTRYWCGPQQDPKSP
jgi:endonuclease YncB( thermonuclease family)